MKAQSTQEALGFSTGLPYSPCFNALLHIREHWCHRYWQMLVTLHPRNNTRGVQTVRLVIGSPAALI